MKNVALIGEIHPDGIDILNDNQCKVIYLNTHVPACVFFYRPECDSTRVYSSLITRR